MGDPWCLPIELTMHSRSFAWESQISDFEIIVTSKQILGCSAQSASCENQTTGGHRSYIDYAANNGRTRKTCNKPEEPKKDLHFPVEILHMKSWALVPCPGNHSGRLFCIIS